VYSAPAGTQFPLTVPACGPCGCSGVAHAPAAARIHHCRRLSDDVGCILPDVSKSVRSASRQQASAASCRPVVPGRFCGAGGSAAVYSAPAGTQFPLTVPACGPCCCSGVAHAPAAARIHHCRRPSDGVGCIRPDVSESVRSASRQLVYTPYVICCETVLAQWSARCDHIVKESTRSFSS
jgi:hypothetical protein